jgi:hypothetical protein
MKVVQNETGGVLRECELDFEKNQSDLSNFENTLKDNKTRL